MRFDRLMAAAASPPVGWVEVPKPACSGGGEPMLAERRERAESLDDNYAEFRQQRAVNPVNNIRRPRGRVFTSKRHQ